MKKRISGLFLAGLFGLLLGLPGAVSADDESGRFSLWIDVYDGEPLSYEGVFEDLATVGVVYLGEAHTIVRHHDIQERIVTDLAKQGKPMVLALEQMESFQQPIVDRYNRGEISFDELAKETKWSQRWGNYEQYRTTIEAAHKLNVPILALNARAETIRQVARGGGIDRLDPKLRKELPADVLLDDPLYKKLLTLRMMVHAAANPETLRPMVEAQIARDEAMASALCEFLKSEAGRDRTAVVLCGGGHIAYGLGTPTRVRRQLPDVKDRIVLLSASGDVVLSKQEVAQARSIVITHEQMRQIDRPIADYLHQTSLKTAEKKAE